MENNNSIKDLFSDSNYCKDEMVRIRKGWGLKDFYKSQDKIDAARTTLGFMYLYCKDENLLIAIEAMLNELSQREILVLLHR